MAIEKSLEETPIEIGFVSTRLAGTDGVSLETAKWASVLEKRGHPCFYFAGELDYPTDKSFLVPEAHFRHPTIEEIQKHCFGTTKRERKTTRRIQEVKELLKDKLYEFIEKFGIDMLVVENALTIPMNIPLGLAITEFITETNIPTIAHHHDFYWERQRFAISAVGDYLDMAFPSNLPSMKHAVINTPAQLELAHRTGISSTVVPNVHDFETPPPPLDGYGSTLRAELGIAQDEVMLLQPTRIVARKGVEHAIELAKRLNAFKKRVKLVISHKGGDEGDAYVRRVLDYVKLLGVNLILCGNRINDHRGTDSRGRKIYTLGDAYQSADLVTYPSTYEGFGNAFLEAVYYKKPLVVNRYSVYATDIAPKGFKVIEMDQFLTEAQGIQVEQVLYNNGLCERITEHNYRVAAKFFSFSVLEKKLASIEASFFGV